MAKRFNKKKQARSPLVTFAFVLAFLILLTSAALIVVASPTLRKSVMPEQSLFLKIKCPDCSNNPLAVQECATLLERTKSDPELLNYAQQIGFDFESISKVDKRLVYHKAWGEEAEKQVTCVYWNNRLA